MAALIFQLSLLLASCVAVPAMKTSSCVPKHAVDLGYATHGISFQNVTDQGHVINVYQNIRFADTPAGRTRFRKPSFPPSTNPTSEILTGSYSHDTRCVSTVPQGAEVLFPGLNGTVFGSEDCLFLDVYVPANLSCPESLSKNSKPLPVVHWLYGSAFSFGSKEMMFTPLGIYDQLLSHDQPFILVASNYRMGLYGWMSSPKEDQTDANIGMYDGLAALKWTQKHIQKFGGDPNRVTAIGQSAGATIIELIASGPSPENEPLPFQQAFISSSAMPLKRNVTERRQEVFEVVLDAANCTSLACLQRLSVADLAKVNQYVINEIPSMSGGGNFGPGIGFGPVVDGDVVPDLPIANPDLVKSLSRLKGIVISNMGSEGSITSSDANMPAAFPSLVRKLLPSATNETINSIQSLYDWRPEFPEQLAWDWVADAIFVCHSLAIADAAPKITRRYVMTIPPAYHGLDLAYLLFSNLEITPVENITTARSLQTFLGQFLYRQNPLVTDDGIRWAFYGDRAAFLNISTTGMAIEDTGAAQRHRCSVINKIFRDPSNGV